MRLQLTKIEKLDTQYPGLADDVGKWFSQGISSCKVANLIFEKYRMVVVPRTVGGFRSRRWVPEQKLLREKRIAARAAQEAAREREIRQSLARQALGETP